MSRLVFYLALVCLALLGLVVYVVWSQGIKDIEWRKHFASSVVFDSYGVPTVYADSWEQIYELQGFVVASERLWQMDLLRRKASGRLSEWFGERSLEHDRRMILQDRVAIAKEAVDRLPTHERQACDAYAKGVNRFITEYPYRWGVEYFLMMTEPLAWSCQDTIYVFMNLVETLTSQADRELENYQWAQHLSPSWQALLFPKRHPWNQPLFGQNARPHQGVQNQETPNIQPPTPAILKHGLSPDELKAVAVSKDFHDGSNSWAYASGEERFLANDPHLGQSVPGIWYLNRLFVSQGEWGVGASIPGIPGIILGRNPYLAWAFTNTGEDIDDYVFEELDEEGLRYKDYDLHGHFVWKPITVKQGELAIKGRKTPLPVEARFTERGPLVLLPDGRYASRQWLMLRPELYRLPVTELLTSRNADDMQRSLSHLTLPAQNVTYFTSDGVIGFKISGTGILRQSSGLLPQSAQTGAWLGLQSPHRRYHLERKIEKNIESDQPVVLATANEQIWVDEVGHHWAGDDRKQRIVEVLEEPNLTLADMQKLQLDTHSEFRKLLLRWFAEQSFEFASEWQKQQQRNWLAWDGRSRSNPKLFREADFVEMTAYSILLNRVYTSFFPDAAGHPERAAPRYSAWLKRVLLLNIMQQPSLLEAFGLTRTEFVSAVLDSLEQQSSQLQEHQLANRWAAQHPFADGFPLIGLLTNQLFSVHEHPQWGAYDTVNAESPRHGPSLRVVWDLRSPLNSKWSIPVGQSGHIGSKFFSNLQSVWVKDDMVPVFPHGPLSGSSRHSVFFN